VVTLLARNGGLPDSPSPEASPPGRSSVLSRVLRRLGHAAITLAALSVLSFLFLELAPGDYLDGLRLSPEMSESTREALRARHGLDRSLPTRYGLWIQAVARGEWGFSFAYGVPVAPLLWDRALNSLLLTGSATLLAWLMAIPIGVFWALFGRGWTSALWGFFTALLLCVPEVLLALGLLFVAAETGAFPVGGMRSADAGAAGPLADLARHLVLPVTALALSRMGGLARHVRASLAEALRMPPIQLMQASGVSTRRILFGHLLPLAANPLMTLLGLSIAGLLSGSLIVEVIMGWPGLGSLLLEAILARDTYVVIGATMCSAFLLLVGGAIGDLLLHLGDPRIASP
jgi:peptide/nickel transport system permease protein